MILLDTHVWVWWLGVPHQLSAMADKAIDAQIPDGSVHVSSISVWEVALLVKRGRLALSMDLESWLQKSEALPWLTFVPVDNTIALRSVGLADPLHNDPADRIIIATALRLGLTSITKDDKIRGYPLINTIW